LFFSHEVLFINETISSANFIIQLKLYFLRLEVYINMSSVKADVTYQLVTEPTYFTSEREFAYHCLLDCLVNKEGGV